MSEDCEVREREREREKNNGPGLVWLGFANREG